MHDSYTVTLKTLWGMMYTFVGIASAMGAFVGWEWLFYILLAWAIVVGVVIGRVLADWCEHTIRVYGLMARGKLRGIGSGNVVDFESVRREREGKSCAASSVKHLPFAP